MEELLLIAGAVIAFTVPVWLLVRSGHRKVVSAMRLAAEDLGLALQAGSPWGRTPGLVGRIDGFDVSAAGVGGQNRGRFLTVRIAGGGLDPALRVAEREASSTALTAARVMTGDPLFDGKWLVEGPAGQALALLDEPARAALLEAGVDVAIEARDGAVHVRRLGGDTRWDLVVDAVRAGLEVARRLRPMPAARLPDRLAERAASDPEPAARAAVLGLLLREHPGHPALERALADAADDPAPEVRRLVLEARGTPADGRLSLSTGDTGGGVSVADPPAEGALTEAD